MKLHQKTTLILLSMFTIVISVVGATFFLSTKTMLQDSQSEQASSFAYGLSATLGGMADPRRDIVQLEFAALDKTPNLEFLVLTNVEGRMRAATIVDKNAWNDYRAQLEPPDRARSVLGQIQTFSRDGINSYGISVPVFDVGAPGGSRQLVGYLHAAFGSQGMQAQLRFLQAFVLFTCIAVVLLSLPLASLIARNITIPIQRLAGAAHALADGDLSHRVTLTRRDELGELAGAFNRMADTVQRQQAHIRRINAGLEQKVGERTAELEAVNKRLEAEVADKEDFLRAVSHDLNAPLRNIAGMASMLALKYQHSLEKDALQRLDRIQKNVQVECELINELLELSRIRTRREKIERVDLHDLLDAIVDGFSNDLETRGINLRIMSHLPVMRCEKMRMRQVFQNLIDNSIKYMKPGGEREIRISLRWTGGDAVFSVEDTGMGIAREDLPHLFHVFRRAKNASVMKVPGKGVGLASVKSIVANYNGKLWVESHEGHGTTVFVAIPGTHFEATTEVAL
jgi:signal transduction histidine kinase